MSDVSQCPQAGKSGRSVTFDNSQIIHISNEIDEIQSVLEFFWNAFELYVNVNEYGDDKVKLDSRFDLNGPGYVFTWVCTRLDEINRIIYPDGDDG